MKKLLFILMITVFTSSTCSKKGDITIIGKWHIVSAIENEKDIPLSSCELYGSFNFFDDNACVIKKAYQDIHDECIPKTLKGFYTFNDNVLTYKEGNDYETRTRITELTPSSLKLTEYYIREGLFIDETPVNEQRTYTLKRIK